jgi:hypothetical protein
MTTVMMAPKGCPCHCGHNQLQQVLICMCTYLVITDNSMTHGPAIDFLSVAFAAAAKAWIDSMEGSAILKEAFESAGLRRLGLLALASYHDDADAMTTTTTTTMTRQVPASAFL